MRSLQKFALVIVSIGMSLASCGEEHSAPLVLESLFNIGPDSNAPSTIEQESYSPALHGRIVEYQRRAACFKSRMKPPKGPWEVQMAFEKKIQVEKGIVALIPTNGIEALASDFAKKLPLAYEWEGSGEPPFEEASYVEEYLLGNPDTPLKPYLLLFLLHRYSYAWYGFAADAQADLQVKSEGFYQKNLDAARAAPDPLVKRIAEELHERSPLNEKRRTP